MAGFVLAAVMVGDPLGNPLGVDASILRWAEGVRTSFLVNVAKAFNLLATTGESWPSAGP